MVKEIIAKKLAHPRIDNQIDFQFDVGTMHYIWNLQSKSKFRIVDRYFFMLKIFKYFSSSKVSNNKFENTRILITPTRLHNIINLFKVVSMKDTYTYCAFGKILDQYSKLKDCYV